MIQATGKDVAPGFRLCPDAGEDDPRRPASDTGNFLGTAIYVDGQEVVLVSELEAGWYRYVSEWRLHADGTIRPRFAFDASRAHASATCTTTTSTGGSTSTSGRRRQRRARVQRPAGLRALEVAHDGLRGDAVPRPGPQAVLARRAHADRRRLRHRPRARTTTPRPVTCSRFGDVWLLRWHPERDRRRPGAGHAHPHRQVQQPRADRDRRTSSSGTAPTSPTTSRGPRSATSSGPTWCRTTGSRMLRASIYWRAIATRKRSSGVIRWSASSASSPMSICTQLTVPVNVAVLGRRSRRSPACRCRCRRRVVSSAEKTIGTVASTRPSPTFVAVDVERRRRRPCRARRRRRRTPSAPGASPAGIGCVAVDLEPLQAEEVVAVRRLAVLERRGSSRRTRRPAR